MLNKKSLKENDRNYDYLLATNFLTAYILICSGKFMESLSFIQVSEKMLNQLLKKVKQHV